MKLLLIAIALTAQACASTEQHMTDAVPAVEALLARQEAAWNAGDIETFMAEGYWNSNELTFLSGGDWRRGYDEVLQRYRERYLSDGAQMGQLTFSDLEIDSLSPDSALARGRYHLDFTDGTTADGLFTLCLRRTSGQWRIVHDHTSTSE